jgi:hypothetical protein
MGHEHRSAFVEVNLHTPALRLLQPEDLAKRIRRLRHVLERRVNEQLA